MITRINIFTNEIFHKDILKDIFVIVVSADNLCNSGWESGAIRMYLISLCNRQIRRQFGGKLLRAYMQSALYAISRPPACPSVRPSITRAHQSKRLKLESCNFHHRVAQSLWFLRYKFGPNSEILTFSAEREPQTRVGWGKQAIFWLYASSRKRYEIQLIGRCLCAFDWHQG